ncbi:MAG TPA: carboxypeptidase-like regulatory domain-containing protein, partial [Verrucomicrobiae bacterium]|nr:carboxypeptidase-like regulatory domain-containing protein [Verrucomicrobiae bacterium]
TQRVERLVRLRLMMPKGQTPPDGKFEVLLRHQENSYGGHQMVEITNGMVELKVELPASVGYESSALTGYWVERKWPEKISPGSAPLELTVPCFSAGAIYGTITDSDDTPAKGVWVAVVQLVQAPDLPLGAVDLEINRRDGADNDAGTFIAASIPLGGRYQIVAYRKANFQISSPIVLSEANPLQKVELKLMKGVTVSGVILTPEGHPAPGIRFRMETRVSESHSFGSEAMISDGAGRFKFENVNPALDGIYSLGLQNNPGFQQAIHEFKVDGKSLSIHLQPGHSVSGVLIDDATGRPAPGLAVYVTPQPLGGKRSYVEADEITDQEGKFLLSTLDEGNYAIGVRSATLARSSPVLVNARDKKPVTIRVLLPKPAR